jgi:hypothetical protein
MRKIELQVAETVADLDGLPAGSRILTATGMIAELDVIEEGRRDSGRSYWIQPGTLQPFPAPPRRWLPAYILPAGESA